jgi:hypothetical protein
VNSPILRRLAFLTLALPFSLAAQKLDPTFSILTVAEHNVKAPAGDQDAEAVILFDIAKTRFVNVGAKGFVIMFHRMKRVKVLARSGVKHAEVSVPFYREGRDRSERVASVEAITYNLENGRIIKRTLDPALQEEPAEKKYQAIINYVRSQFRWDERSGFLATKSPKAGESPSSASQDLPG